MRNLSDATIKGILRAVLAHLRVGTSAGRRNERGYNPPQIALARGNPAAVEALLVAGASMIGKTAAVDAFLRCAAYDGRPRTLAALLAMADVLNLGAFFVHSSNLCSDGPLAVAARAGNSGAMSLRLAEIALVYATRFEAALRHAASFGHHGVVGNLFCDGMVGITRHPAGRRTTLQVSAAAGHLRIVHASTITETVYFRKAIANTKNYADHRVLHLPVVGGHFQIADALVRMGACPSMSRTPLHLAVGANDGTMVGALLQHILSTAYDQRRPTMPLDFPIGEDVAAAMRLVSTITEAVDARHSPTAEVVLRLIMSKKAVNDLLVRAAVVSGREGILLALLAGRTSLSRLNDGNRFTPVHVPLTRGSHDVVHVLPELGDGDSLDEQGSGCEGAPLQLTSHGRCPEVVEVPFHCRAPVYKISREGFFHVRMTARRDPLTCAAILAVRGGGVENASGYGRALLIDTSAKGCGDTSTVQLHHRAPTSARGRFDDVPVAMHRDCSLSSGALVHSTDHAGNTSIDVAVGKHIPGSVQLLLQHLAGVACRYKTVVAPLRTRVPGEFADVERAVIAKRQNPAIVRCLFEAIVSNREDLLHALLQGGVRLSIPSEKTQQLLQVAAKFDSPHAVETLLRDYGANPNDTHLSGVTCLYLAAKQGFSDVVKILLRFKADYNIVDMFGNSALMEAASEGHDAVVLALLEAGANPWASKYDGNTVLHLAVKRGHSSTVDILVREGNADAHAFNHSGESPLSFAAASGYTESVVSLLGEGPPTRGFESLILAIYIAASRGRVDCLKAIVNYGVPIDLKAEAGWSPLQRAVRKSDYEAAIILLQHGASVTQLYYHGNSIMHYTTDGAMMEYLIDYNAPVNWCNLQNFTPLHIAAKMGREEAVKLLLANTYELWHEIDSKSDEGLTALHYAVKGGYLRVVDVLLAGGASSSVADYTGQTAVHIAVDLDDVDVLNILLSDDLYAAKIVDNSGRSPIHLAAQHGYMESLTFLLSSAIGWELRDYQREFNGWTPLHIATAAGCCDAVHELLLVNASPDKRDISLQTPLHIAAASGNARLVILLLDGGASIDVKDHLGLTPLLVAVRCECIRIVQVMLTEGASSKTTNLTGQTAIHIAAESKGRFCREIVQDLIAHGAPVAHQDRQGYTPLHVAVMKGRTDVVLAILEARQGECGISVVDNKNGFTPLHYAAGLEHSAATEDIVAMLLAHGAPVDARNQEGTSPLFRACAYENLSVVQTLLSSGASPGTGGKEGFTLLHDACMKGQTEVVRLLLDNGAVPGHCWNSLGVSPLHRAAKEGHLEVVKLLLPRLVVRQINLSNKHGRTPLVEAVRRGHGDIVDVVSTDSLIRTAMLWAKGW